MTGGLCVEKSLGIYVYLNCNKIHCCTRIALIHWHDLVTWFLYFCQVFSLGNSL